MKKVDEEGKELLAGEKVQKLSDIRDQIIVGGGDKLREVMKKQKEDSKKRLDESK